MLRRHFAALSLAACSPKDESKSAPPRTAAAARVEHERLFALNRLIDDRDHRRASVRYRDRRPDVEAGQP